MSPWLPMMTDLLWRTAVGVVPLALIVGAICRWTPCRPATRHMLWLGALLWLVGGLVLPPVAARRPIGNLTTAAQQPEPEPITRVAPAAEPRPSSHSTHRPSDCPTRGEPRWRTVRPARSLPQVSWPHPPGRPARAMELPSTAFDDPPSRPTRIDGPRPVKPTRTGAWPSVLPRASSTPGRPQHHPPPLRTGGSPPPVQPTGPSSKRTPNRARWINRLVAGRDPVGQLPAVPPLGWLGGVLLMLGPRAWRMHHLRRPFRAVTL